MTNRKKNIITSYWLKTPELFSEKYEWNLTRLFSPTSLFLQARRKKVLELIGKFKDKNILDVGCGSGIFMLEFINRGARVTGVDYSKRMIELASQLLEKYQIEKKLYKLKIARASKLNLKEKSYDVILATGLTDYIPLDETKKFIEQSSKLLGKKGIIVISFPSTESPFSFLRRGLGLKIRQNLFHLPPIASTYTEEEIGMLLKKYGFKIEDMSKIYYAMWIVKARLDNPPQKKD